ncbi:hypothetical protein ACVCDU_24180 (plasmid) [Escherichia coli]
MMLLFRDKEPTFSLASSPVMINGNASSGEEDSKKEPASKNIGDEQLSLLRLLAGKFPHEIRMLRALLMKMIITVN